MKRGSIGNVKGVVNRSFTLPYLVNFTALILLCLKVIHRIHTAVAGAGCPQFKMKAVSGRVTGGANFADCLSLDHCVPHRYQLCGHMTVHRPRAVGVGDRHIIPKGGTVGGQNHCTALRRQDICAVRGGEVHAAVKLPPMIRTIPIPEGRGNSGVSRQRSDIAPISGGEFVPEGIVLQDNRDIFCTAIA